MPHDPCYNDIVIEISPSIQNIEVDVAKTIQDVQINLQGQVTTWGNILGDIENQSDLWSYLSSINVQALTDYLSTNNVLISSATITDNLSVGKDLFVGGTIYTGTTAIVLGTFNTVIGDGITNVYDIGHNLGTKDISVIVRDLATNVLSYPSIQVLNDFEARLTFNFVPGISSYGVSVFAGVPSTRVAAFSPDILEKPRAYTLYVSMSGRDTNSGRDPNFSLRTIKRACQIAHNDRVLAKNNPLEKYSIQVATGDYTEDNPIYVPSTVSIIGDNLRRCTIRPKNKQYDILWVDNSSYVWGFTFRDHLEPAAAVAFPDLSNPTLTAIALSSLFVPFVRSTLIYNKEKCKRDVGFILSGVQIDIVSGNNDQSIINGLAYYTGMNLVLPTAQITPTIQAIRQAQALTENYISLYSGTSSLSSSLLSSINIPFDTVVGIISGGPSNYTNQTFLTTDNALSAATVIQNYTEQIKTGVITYIDTLYPDIYKWRRPFITTSPYIQGSSSITTGINGISAGCGMRVDGSLAEGFLRSMVLDSYTQFNQGGQGIHILKNGYAQLVSIFTICCTEGIKCESGGTCSISNSNCSFGLSGIVSTGKSLVPILTGTLVRNPFGSNVFVVTDVDGTIINPTSDYYSPSAAIDTRKIAYTPYNGLIFSINDDPEFFVIDTPSPTLSAGTTNTFTINITQNTFRNFSPGGYVKFYLRSAASASSHTFEYIGTGVNLDRAVPALGGITQNDLEVCFDDNGIVFFTSTNEGGDFNVGEEFKIVQETGTIEGDTFKRSILTLVTPLTLALE
jgi:hypothetical protein